MYPTKKSSDPYYKQISVVTAIIFYFIIYNHMPHLTQRNNQTDKQTGRPMTIYPLNLSIWGHKNADFTYFVKVTEWEKLLPL